MVANNIQYLSCDKYMSFTKEHPEPLELWEK